jgi:hypothetical protein
MSEPSRLAVALLHHPVLDRRGDIVTTSVTNVDLHDIARISRTYGAEPFYAVTPVAAQQDMIRRVTGHWVSGWAARVGHPRTEALQRLHVCSSLSEARIDYEARVGGPVSVAVTGASLSRDLTTFAGLRTAIREGRSGPILLLFGTGWGLGPEVVDAADLRLEPIRGGTDFNHLPVRAAVAIALDRLVGPGI